jgi:hypothetical protein
VGTAESVLRLVLAELQHIMAVVVVVPPISILVTQGRAALAVVVQAEN